jgi:hypothetical protein
MRSNLSVNVEEGSCMRHTMSQGDCSHHAISDVETWTKPLDVGVSPSRALRRVDFPDATGPIIKVNEDEGKSILIL